MFGALQFRVRLENFDTCIDLLTFGLRVAAIDFGCAPYFLGSAFSFSIEFRLRFRPGGGW
jgi:hypothetical protein